MAPRQFTTPRNRIAIPTSDRRPEATSVRVRAPASASWMGRGVVSTTCGQRRLRLASISPQAPRAWQTNGDALDGLQPNAASSLAHLRSRSTTGRRAGRVRAVSTCRRSSRSGIWVAGKRTTSWKPAKPRSHRALRGPSSRFTPNHLRPALAQPARREALSLEVRSRSGNRAERGATSPPAAANSLICRPDRRRGQGRPAANVAKT